jgi:tetratricopeptide (TPR) repeat protein
MFSLRPIPIAITITTSLALCLSCSSLNYPVAEPVAEPVADQTADPVADSTAESISGGGLEDPLNAEEDEPLTWSDLTRLAREHRQQGELDQARDRLAQAAIQVGDLPPSHAQRRTVFGLRARLAIDFAAEGDLEAADALADELIAEAEETPEVGGSALVALAVSVADRRQEAARENGEPESQLELLRIALATAQAGSVGRDRMNLALRVAREAARENEIMLARTAIDQALSDALQVIPANKEKIASIQLEHARIALASGDFDTAKKSATAANRTIDQTDADASTRGIAEATLAEILAETGEAETALIVATGAKARIGSDEKLTPYAQRRILTSLARVESSLGDRRSARTHFEQALSIPGQDLRADSDLVAELIRELDEWDDTERNRTELSPEPSSALSVD